MGFKLYNQFFSVFLLLLFFSISNAFAVLPSSINLTVETSATNLSAIINQSLPTELYKSRGGVGTGVKLSRIAPVSVTASDNYIHLNIPVQLVLFSGFYESPALRADLRFKTRVDVTPDWRLKTEVYYTGLSDNVPQTMKIGPISMNPRSILESITLPVQRIIAPVIDSKINDAVQLKNKVSPLWQNAFNPILLNKEFSIWLKLTPDKILMTPLSASSNNISLSIGIITGAEVTVGRKPSSSDPKSLPAVQQISSFDKSFHIQVPTNIFFSDLVTALNPVLLDKTFGDDKKITVKNFHLRGDNGRLVVVMTTTGSFDGELTILAKPLYKTESSSLVFEDVDFDTKNAGWLISTGSWLFSSAIRSTIKEKLDSAVAEQLVKAREKASLAMSSLQLADRVKLTGTVKNISLGESSVMDDRLTILVLAQGEAGIILK